MGAGKRVKGLLPGKNRRAMAAGGLEEKFRRSRSLYDMKIAVNLADLTSEQVKCLSQLGEFRSERTWEAVCDPDHFEGVADLLKGAGIEDMFVQFGD
jgi:hypothetical protein